MSLKDLIEREYTSVTVDTKIKDVARLMLNNKVGVVIVVKKMNRIKRIPVGIVTDRDITLYMGKSKSFHTDDYVEKAMSSNVVLGRESDGVAETIRKMKNNGIKRLPIVDSLNYLIGLVDSDDLYRLLSKELLDLSLVYKPKTVTKLNATWAEMPEFNDQRRKVLI